MPGMIEFTFSDGYEVQVGVCCDDPRPNYWHPTQTVYCMNCDTTYATLSWEKK